MKKIIFFLKNLLDFFDDARAMIRIDDLRKVYSPIVIPPFAGLATNKLRQEHEMDRIDAKTIKIGLTVYLELHEVGGNKIFQLFNVFSEFRVNIIGDLTTNDLYEVWKKASNNCIKAFNKFEDQKGMRKTEINVGQKSHYEEFLSGLVAWFHSP
jgi:hypothetical protein